MSTIGGGGGNIPTGGNYPVTNQPQQTPVNESGQTGDVNQVPDSGGEVSLRDTGAPPTTDSMDSRPGVSSRDNSAPPPTIDSGDGGSSSATNIEGYTPLSDADVQKMDMAQITANFQSATSKCEANRGVIEGKRAQIDAQLKVKEEINKKREDIANQISSVRGNDDLSDDEKASKIGELQSQDAQLKALSEHIDNTIKGLQADIDKLRDANDKIMQAATNDARRVMQQLEQKNDSKEKNKTGGADAKPAGPGAGGAKPAPDTPQVAALKDAINGVMTLAETIQTEETARKMQSTTGRAN